jgi:hypothetical protein
MHICMHNMHAHMYAYTHVCPVYDAKIMQQLPLVSVLRAHDYICMHVYLRTCVYVHTHTYSVRVHIHTAYKYNAYKNTHKHAHIGACHGYIKGSKHTHTHTHTHTHIPIQVRVMGTSKAVKWGDVLRFGYDQAAYSEYIHTHTFYVFILCLCLYIHTYSVVILRTLTSHTYL